MTPDNTAEVVNKSELHWDPNVGFELDVDVTAGQVAVRMVRVPVPADGIERLRASPVALYALDTLFKSHVDVGGAPGQVNDVKVQVQGDELALTAVVEDAETGETLPLEVKLPLRVDAGAPESGGPMPTPPDEDDLDWEDEETFDRLFEGSPEAVAAPEPPDDVTDEAEPAKGGLSALLKALMSEDLDASLDRAAKPEPKPADEPKPAPPAPAPGGSMLMDSHAEARAFLQLLVDQEQLELVEGGTVETMVADAAPILAREISPEAKASVLADWLLGRDEVEELYIDDDSLAALLDQW